MIRQHTLKKSYVFEGKGLHTGRISHMVVGPAPVDAGVCFHRVDIGEDAVVAALAENVSDTSRSTTLSANGCEVHTVEHLLSALTGLGVDNARIEIDNLEVPILDGSARPYVEAILADGLLEQDAPRRPIVLTEPLEVRDDKTGSWVRLEPADAPGYRATVDFGSRVLGIQDVSWDGSAAYARDIAPCRTFVFFHELEFLAAHNLIKGGDVDNAIVIVEHPVTQEQLDRMTDLFGQPHLTVGADGYLSNLQLHDPHECGRHKLLDLIGDLRLTGGFLQARVTAYKPGHTINTATAKALRARLKQEKKHE